MEVQVVDDFRHEASTVHFLAFDGTVSDERSFEDRTVSYVCWCATEA